MQTVCLGYISYHIDIIKKYICCIQTFVYEMKIITFLNFSTHKKKDFIKFGKKYFLETEKI